MQHMNKKSKNFIKIICVLFIILILCILYYVVQINIAKNYFDDGKYTKSYNSVKYLPKLFNDNLKKYDENDLIKIDKNMLIKK